MTRSTLAPVFAGLRYGLHALLVGLTVFAVARAMVIASPHAMIALYAAVAFVAVYAWGALAARQGRNARVAGAHPVAEQGSPRWMPVLWVMALTAIWVVLFWAAPDGAYLVFPLFFLYLHVLPLAAGIIAILITTAIAVTALGAHLGFSVGGVVGPLVGAGVAILIGLGYRALARESDEREALVEELLRTRTLLAATEREQGALAERARLAREIHDTVAQGLSSIQMLLHAAERTSVEPGLSHLRLARQAAAESLAETRGIIRELTPASLDDGLLAALRRLAADQSLRSGLAVEVVVLDEQPGGGADGDGGSVHPLPMHMQTALLRIAQSAISNAVQHAEASRAEIVFAVSSTGGVSLTVRDDGKGFDPGSIVPRPEGSFGLRAIADRAEQLGGTLVVDSAPGNGTTLTVTLPIPREES